MTTLWWRYGSQGRCEYFTWRHQNGNSVVPSHLFLNIKYFMKVLMMSFLMFLQEKCWSLAYSFMLGICSKSFPADANKCCFHCGHKVGHPAPPPLDIKAIYCGQCGTSLGSTARCSSNCGTPVGQWQLYTWFVCGSLWPQKRPPHCFSLGMPPCRTLFFCPGAFAPTRQSEMLDFLEQCEKIHSGICLSFVLTLHAHPLHTWSHFTVARKHEDCLYMSCEMRFVRLTFCVATQSVCVCAWWTLTCVLSRVSLENVVSCLG